MKSDAPKTVDEYIAGFPADVQDLLQRIRQTIRQAAPDAVERIAYQMPTFVLGGNLVHFAAYKSHIGFYPTPSAIEKYRQEFSVYKGSKGAVQFPIHGPIPFDLIAEVVRFRVEENRNRYKARKK